MNRFRAKPSENNKIYKIALFRNIKKETHTVVKRAATVTCNFLSLGKIHIACFAEGYSAWSHYNSALAQPKLFLSSLN